MASIYLVAILYIVMAKVKNDGILMDDDGERILQELLQVHYTEVHSEETRGEVISGPNHCDNNV